jgi:SAM-dependent methyltransferase
MEAIMSNEQTTLWNGRAGHAWVEAQELTDRLYQPFADRLVATVAADGHPARVLDIGCGTGATTVALARRLEAPCVGVDISAPMIDAARVRAEREGAPATFLLADAQACEFDPAGFDAIVSRFGVMFFDDPVRAFDNLRRAAKPNARLQLQVWRSAAENPFMTTAERAAAPLLPNLPPRRPDVPGQFGFADRDRVRGILAESGWDAIDIRPLDVECSLTETELVRYFTVLGPVGQALRDADEPTRRRVVETVRPAFDPYVQDGEVRFTAACWEIAARAPQPAVLPHAGA